MSYVNNFKIGIIKVQVSLKGLEALKENRTSKKVSPHCIVVLVSGAELWLWGSVHTKGQLISKCLFGVFKSPKKPMKFIS
jgi:hypothetical protein